ncbi:hypothetical protein [Hyalangium rubrum]|uniref:RDD domain-containing protein n=1 Tax=Hyalangium rubrum TaxID=3103134 RepID=A0ABU5H8Z1_9BACT|nr:hypothetical protein [Hyalangium sp. s54d21]MDY7229952.1 hypothetical protein [Hyalangium sp. s54d21]
MPTEVLVMCTGCGRPQPARKGPCVACGVALPDAPVPSASAPEQPFLSLEWRGGRTLVGVDRRLTYRADTASSPLVVELGNLRSVTLGRRFLLEALAVVPLAIVLALLLPSMRPVAAAASGLALLVAVLWRRYFLVLGWAHGGGIRWPLGTARLGSARALRIDTAWASAAPALASRGVSVQEAPGTLGPRA